MTTARRNTACLLTEAGRYGRILVVLLVAAALRPAPAAAQGWIEPRPDILPAQWGIEKLRTVVNVQVRGRVATVEVEEWFRNNGGGLGEGDYVYPLPGEAVFTGYSLYQGDDELRGELMDAGRAREIYESIVRARKDPALIELLGKGMLRARVFPIAAGETRRITLRYTQLLERAGDGLQFRYAAGGRNVGLRPMGTRPLRAADSAPVTFTLSIDDGGRFHEPFSPTHRLNTERRGSRLTVRPATELAGDFAVFLPFSTSAVGVTLATHNPAGDDGYFMLTLSPGAAGASRIPRDVTVVVDVSGSMSGEKMEQARGALRQLLGTLDAGDRFRMIAFSSAVRPWRDDWTHATRAELRAAREWVDGLRADGGTNIFGALETALKARTPADRLPIVVFMTDGLATVGETRTDRIVAMAEGERGRARIFAFGVGYDVSTLLLDALSEAARGTTQYVKPGEDVEQPVSVLAARIRYPVLTDLALGSGPVRVTEIYPRQIPDLFAGEDLVLFGRYTGSGTGNLAVTGRRDGRSERYAAAVVFPARDETNDYIPRLWASRRLGDLDRRIRSAQADGASRRQLDELIEELRETALRYGLLSEYTAYLVQEPTLVASRPGIPGQPHPRPLRGPVGAGGLVPPPATMTASSAQGGAAAHTGQTAVLRAEHASRARAVTTVAELDAVHGSLAGPLPGARAAGTGQPAEPAARPVDGSTRTVAGRTFALTDGEWRDVQEAPGLDVISIEPYSPAYFALVRALPELAVVLRHVEPARVAGGRLVIHVAPGGTRTLDDAAVARIVAGFRGRGL